MQVTKEYIKEDILKEARRLFLAKGFPAVSMREIAAGAHITVSNIYNYFKNKDTLFRTVVSPAVSAFERMLDEHHGRNSVDILAMQSEDYLRYTVSEYIDILRRHREEITLLLFHAQGSSLQNFKDEFTDRSTALVRRYFERQKQLHEELNTDVSDFFVHLHAVWMFTLFEELIVHRVAPEEVEKIVQEYIRFEITGWRELMEI